MTEQLRIRYRIISELRHAEYNPRYMTAEDRQDIRQSLEAFGAVDPAVVNMAANRENIVIGGNQRITVAREDLKWEKYPCVHLQIEDETMERELNLRLNKNLGRWDQDALREFGEEFLQKCGWNDDEIATLFDQMPPFQPNEDVEGGGGGNLRNASGVVMCLNKWNFSIGECPLKRKIFQFFGWIEEKRTALSEEEFKVFHEGVEVVFRNNLEGALKTLLPQEGAGEVPSG